MALGGVVETQFRLRTASDDDEEALQRQVDEDDVRVLVFFVLTLFLSCLLACLLAHESTISILFLGLMNCRRNDAVMEQAILCLIFC